MAKNLQARIAAREARLKELVAKHRAGLEKLRRRQMAEIAGFVRKVGADQIEPEVLVGLLLRGIEAVKDEAVEAECRAAGKAWFAANERKRKGDGSAVQTPPLSAAAE